MAPIVTRSGEQQIIALLERIAAALEKQGTKDASAAEERRYQGQPAGARP